MPEPTETPRPRCSKGRAPLRLAYGLRLHFQTRLPGRRRRLRIPLPALALRPSWPKRLPDGKDPGPAPASPDRRRFRPPGRATHHPLPACPQPRPPVETPPPYRLVRSEACKLVRAGRGNRTFSPAFLRPRTVPRPDDSEKNRSREGQNNPPRWG